MSESEGLRIVWESWPRCHEAYLFNTKALLDNTTECLIHTTSVSFLH